MLYAEAKVAKDWGLTPSQWAQEPRWSRATMMAQSETEGDIEFWLVEDSKSNRNT